MMTKSKFIETYKGLDNDRPIKTIGKFTFSLNHTGGLYIRIGTNKQIYVPPDMVTELKEFLTND